MADLDKVVFILCIFDDKDKPAGHHRAENWPPVAYIGASLLHTVIGLPACVSECGANMQIADIIK